MYKPLFPLKAIFYKDNREIEDIWILNNIKEGLGKLP
ncbi:hypothetical protein BSPLISOX_1821 [uncultured Gammaproteobacteria bacterium]|jgi:hypothetical protein|nr:hypothetical protein [uncultured Gammaproteobacteria bacterium]CAC9434400.1 hypothetical protein [uncultured Gammaproteobacteria bacterium]CAC9476138.1 hypothetical protein [uncultured Gammaproteobacteria bacterium]VVH66705.1 hypothetical protein BSPLISOX_1821 [uncultured Gammaproteobacteria bacterium]